MGRMDEFLLFFVEDQHGVHQKFSFSSNGHYWIDKWKEKKSVVWNPGN